MKRPEGKVALISGTVRGQGRAAALRFAAEGPPHGVRANGVSPGTIDTEGSRGNLLADEHPMNGIARHIPLGRAGVPDDAVNAAVFLASDEAAYLTRADLVVDGGWSAVLTGTPSRKAIHT